MVKQKEKNLESNRPLILAVMFLINFFIFILFIHNFNIFIYAYIFIFNIFSLINLIFMKKLYSFIDLWRSLKRSTVLLTKNTPMPTGRPWWCWTAPRARMHWPRRASLWRLPILRGSSSPSWTARPRAVSRWPSSLN